MEIINSQKFTGGEYTGSITVYSDSDIKEFYPKRNRNSHKGTYGSANIIAGSGKYTGAAALASEAALKSGCGYVKLTTLENVKLALVAKYPQIVYLDKPDLSSQCIAIGMGMGVSIEVYEVIQYLICNYKGILIIDADGLNSLSQYGVNLLCGERECRIIMTPHVKEFSRLTGIEINTVLNNPVKYSYEFARRYNVTLLLKGADSVITDGQRVALNTRGTTALAKAGSGDMLSGYMCGTAARGLGAFEAAVCAAYTLGVSAEISSAQKTDYCATAKDILKNLHNAVKQLT